MKDKQPEAGLLTVGDIRERLTGLLLVPTWQEVRRIFAERNRGAYINQRFAEEVMEQQRASLVRDVMRSRLGNRKRNRVAALVGADVLAAFALENLVSTNHGGIVLAVTAGGGCLWIDRRNGVTVPADDADRAILAIILPRVFGSGQP